MGESKKPQFIKTNDADTAATLERLGYTLMSTTANGSIFLNDAKQSFDMNNYKVTYTNILTF